jgi:hypothetical protein
LRWDLEESCLQGTENVEKRPQASRNVAGAKHATEKGRISAGICEKRPSGAKQPAEKLNFSKGAKNGSRQDALGTIRKGWLMVFVSPKFRPFAIYSEFFRSL